MDAGATISACGKYRYCLWRSWAQELGILKWVMLNPSVADARDDDPTIRKCIKFARDLGYGGIRVVNLFAWRATDPLELKKLSYAEAVGPDNDREIIQTLRGPGQNIAAWGQGGKLWGRDTVVREMLDQEEIHLWALKIAKDGFTPYHPLYLRADTKPFYF